MPFRYLGLGGGELQAEGQQVQSPLAGTHVTASRKGRQARMAGVQLVKQRECMCAGAGGQRVIRSGSYRAGVRTSGGFSKRDEKVLEDSE